MDIQNKKKGNTIRFLFGSFILLLFISIAAFFFLGHYMSNVSRKAIDGIGNLYMTGINEQVISHFRTLLELKLEQVETVVEVVSDNTDDTDGLYDELIYRVHARNFNYLALCSKDRTLDMIYGEQVQLDDPEPFFDSLGRGEKKVAIGRDGSGNEIVLFGVEAEYTMRNGEKSIALVVAMPVDYISTML